MDLKKMSVSEIQNEIEQLELEIERNKNEINFTSMYVSYLSNNYKKYHDPWDNYEKEKLNEEINYKLQRFNKLLSRLKRANKLKNIKINNYNWSKKRYRKELKQKNKLV
jgi:hypothetical protein